MRNNGCRRCATGSFASAKGKLRERFGRSRLPQKSLKVHKLCRRMSLVRRRVTSVEHKIPGVIILAHVGCAYNLTYSITLPAVFLSSLVGMFGGTSRWCSGGIDAIQNCETNLISIVKLALRRVDSLHSSRRIRGSRDEENFSLTGRATASFEDDVTPRCANVKIFRNGDAISERLLPGFMNSCLCWRYIKRTRWNFQRGCSTVNVKS